MVGKGRTRRRKKVKTMGRSTKETQEEKQGEREKDKETMKKIEDQRTRWKGIQKGKETKGKKRRVS